MAQAIQLEEVFPNEALTPDQEAMWGETMSVMMFVCPGFRFLFYRLLVNNNGKHSVLVTRLVPIAATDAKNILINPDSFFLFSLSERVFVTAHEIMHNVYGDVEFLHRCTTAGTVPMHDGSMLPFVNELMQMAMDYRINALLVETNIGTMPKVGLYDPKIATGNDDVISVYKKLWQMQQGGKKDKGKPRPGEGDGGGNCDGNNPGGGFDVILKPGKSTGQNPHDAAERNQQQWAVEIAQAQNLEQMRRSRGDMALGLKIMFEKLLNPKVSWTDHIQGFFNRRVGSGSYNWKRPDRRAIIRDLYWPSRSGKGAGWIVVWGDTSGSCLGDVCKYMPELTDILESVRPRRLTVLWCDCAVHRIDEINDPAELRATLYDGVPGGGGTSVHPVMAWIAEQDELPEVFIGFTDGEVIFPASPGYPVIWASVTNKKDYPYGEVVCIK